MANQDDSGKTALSSDGTVSAVGPNVPVPVAPPPVTEFGRYEITGEIARGGMGVVYRARQKGLERIVALKVLMGGVAAAPEKVKRFMQEAQAAAKLQHPNIVPIHDFGAEGGEYFFTMDLIEGESLQDVIARGAVPPKEALAIVRQVAAALQHAHEHGIIHRDIKPGNILIDKDGQVKVTDFGLAKELDSDQMHLTVSGQVMGTPRYMSPEQASGQTAHADQRSDIFSLGVTLYEMLTGRPAFAAESVIEMLHKICNEDPIPPHRLNRKIHRDVETICLHAIEKPPDHRYQSAQELIDDIDRFEAGEPIEARPIGLVRRAGRRLRRHVKLLAINGVIAACCGYWLLYYLHARPGTLHVQVQPADADVLVDGATLTDRELAGQIELKPGQHRIVVQAEPLYEPKQLTVPVKPGGSVTLPVTLPRRTGVLALTTDPPDAAVTIVGPDNFTAPRRGPTVREELPTGPYAVLVHKENHLARRVTVTIHPRMTNTFAFVLPPVTVWTVPTSGSVLSVPVVTECDGALNVIAGDDDGKVYCLSGRSGVALWVFKAGDAVQAPLTVSDVNGDGVPEVLAGATDGRLYCLNARTGQPVWNLETHGAILGPALVRKGMVFVGSADGHVYAAAGATGQIAWKFRTEGRIESCLALAGDAVLAGSADHFLYALQPATGTLLWKADAGAPLLFAPRLAAGPRVLVPTPKAPGDAHTMTAVSLAEHKVLSVGDAFPVAVDLAGNGSTNQIVVSEHGTTCFAGDGKTVVWTNEYAASSAYTADVNGDGWLDLVFNNGPDELLCISGRDGSQLGRIHLETAVGRGYVLDDVDQDGVPDIVVGAGRRVYCFSWVGGRKRWFDKADAYYDAPLASADGRVLAKTSDGVIACYDAERNETVWRVATSPQPSPYAGVAAGQGIVVDADAQSRRLRAWAVADGKSLWSAQLPGGAGAPVGEPVVGTNCVVVGDGATGVHCFALTNGAPRWRQPVAKVTAPVALGTEDLFVVDGESRLRCLALGDGKERWAFAAPVRFASATVAGEDVLGVCDEGVVYALNRQTGQRRWEYKFASARTRTRNRITPDGFLATAAGEVISLDVATGQVRWSVPLKEPVMCAPAVGEVNGVPVVLVGTMGRRVYCLSAKDGARLWGYDVGAQIRYAAPLLVPPVAFIATGPPENGLYCVTATGPRAKDRGWHGPWKDLTINQ